MIIANYLFIFLLILFPVYIITKWVLLYLHFGRDEEPPEVNLADKLHEPPSDLKPYFVDALLNKTLTPTGRSISSTLLYLVSEKWITISYKDYFDDFGDRKREYFMELNLERGKEFENLPLIEQKLLTFIFQGVGNKASFQKIRSYHISKSSVSKKFWKEWKALILTKMVRIGLIDGNSCYMDIYMESELVFIGCVILFSLTLGLDNDIRQILQRNMSFIYIFSGLMLSAIVILKIFKVFFLKRSYLGDSEYSKWKALKNWMEDYAVTRNYPIDSLILWEKYLIYGLALGVSKKALSQLPVKYDIVDEAVAAGLDLFPDLKIARTPLEKYSITDFIHELVQFTAFIPELVDSEKR